MRMNLSIKLRLLLTLGALSALLLIVGLTGLSALDQSTVAMGDLYQNKLVPAMQLGRLLEGYGDNRALLIRAVESQDAARLASARATILANRTQLHADWSAFQKARLSDDEAAVAQRFTGDRAAFQQATSAILAALSSQNSKQAASLVDSALEPAYQRLRDEVQSLYNLQARAASLAYQSSKARERSSKELTMAAIAIGVALGVLLAWLLIRSIMSALTEAERVADRIAAGQLGNHVVIRSEDEIGRLLHALQRMDAKLSEIVGGVLASSESVGVAARQIAQGNDDLSQRTQEQASSLEETASSMEEMTATVRHNAENAAQANQLARTARGQAEDGGQVATQAVAAMAEITSASQRIAEIVGLIDELAFQTNLLSLNAAVEAARSGEQGRGFAVVANEVRNLAQRSAGAAKEIKTLIGESVAKVSFGTELVQRSGAALEGIVESVKKVTDIVAEIAAASAEQSAGIDQVNTAVMQMDEVTQQNAALVEEAAAASRALQEQAEALVSQVGYFRIGATPHATQAQVRTATLGAPVAAANATSSHATGSGSAALARLRKPAGSTPTPPATPRSAALATAASGDWQEF